MESSGREALWIKRHDILNQATQVLAVIDLLYQRIAPGEDADNLAVLNHQHRSGTRLDHRVKGVDYRGFQAPPAVVILDSSAY